MDYWALIQIAIIVFFLAVPLGLLGVFIWLKRVFDENRELQRKELAMMAGDDTRFGDCPACNEPIRSGFQYCPVCRKKLANRCRSCRRFLDLRWTMCPYCGEDYGYTESKEEMENQQTMGF